MLERILRRGASKDLAAVRETRSLAAGLGTF
jgi:hypothetical protein